MYGIDFQEMFPLVAKLNTVRVLLSLSANLYWPFHQFDVKMHFSMRISQKNIHRHSTKFYYIITNRSGMQGVDDTYRLKQSPRA